MGPGLKVGPGVSRSARGPSFRAFWKVLRPPCQAVPGRCRPPGRGCQAAPRSRDLPRDSQESGGRKGRPTKGKGGDRRPRAAPPAGDPEPPPTSAVLALLRPHPGAPYLGSCAGLRGAGRAPPSATLGAWPSRERREELEKFWGSLCSPLGRALCACGGRGHGYGYRCPGPARSACQAVAATAPPAPPRPAPDTPQSRPASGPGPPRQLPAGPGPCPSRFLWNNTNNENNSRNIEHALTVSWGLCPLPGMRCANATPSLPQRI